MIRTIQGKKGPTYSVRWRVDGRPLALNVKSHKLAVRADAYLKLHPDTTRDGLHTYLYGAAESAAPATRTRLTVADLWAMFDRSRRVSETRRVTDGYLWRSQLEEWHARPVDSVTVSGVEAWLGDLADEGYAPSTISVAFRLLRELFKIAERDQLVTYNPLRFVKPPRIPRKAPITARDVFTPAEAVRIVEAAPDRYRALFAVLLYTGARLGEALALTVDTLRLDDATPTVLIGAHRVTEVAGVITIVDGTKTGAHDPRLDSPIPLPAAAVAELRAHLVRYPKRPGELLFVGDQGATPSRSSLRQRYWRPTLDRAGVPYIPMIKLRHTAITHGLAAGITPAGMAARVGHAAGSRMTLDRYARVLPAQVVDDAAKLDAFYA